MNEIETSLRKYEKIHKTWMNTSVFSESSKQIKIELDAAREEYISIMKKYRPNWIVF